MSWKESHICDGCGHKTHLCNKTCDKILKRNKLNAIAKEARHKESMTWHDFGKSKNPKSVHAITHQNKTRGLY